MSQSQLRPRLTGRDLSATRGGRRILDGVDVDVHPGERLALLGPSGSGKTTLLTLLSGLERPDRGAVTLDGTRLTDIAPAVLRRRVGLILQGYGLVSLLDANENVALPLMAAGLASDQRQQRAARALEQVGLGGRGRHLVEELSGGEQQRVAIARALASDPEVLLADEPTAELDALSRARILDLLLQPADSGVAVVLATHDPAVAARCDRQVTVADGRLVQQAA